MVVLEKRFMSLQPALLDASLGMTQSPVREALAAAQPLTQTPERPFEIVSICLPILTVLATTYSLYFGRDLLLPVVMAAVLALVLRPLTQALYEYVRLPLPVGALLVIIFVGVCIAAAAYLISPPSDGWISRAPESLALVKERLAFLVGPIGFVQDALHNIEQFASPLNGAGAPAAGDNLPGTIIFGAAATLREVFITVLVLYFMLATGDRMMRALIEILPRFQDKRRAVEISNEIQQNIASYLLTITAMNALVGVLAGVAAWACGLSNPAVWGALAFLLNFIPIAGPMIGVILFALGGIIGLTWPFPALAPGLIYISIHFLEGQLFTPQLVSHRFELNPVLVILSLLFWDTIWGVPGALLAIPLLAIIKIFCDRIEALAKIGHLIGA